MSRFQQKDEEGIFKVISAETMQLKYGMKIPMVTYKQFTEFEGLLTSNSKFLSDVVRMAISVKYME